MPALGFLQGFLLEKHEKHQCSDMKGADFGGWDPSSAASYSRDRLSPLSTPRLPHLSRGITILVSLGFDLSLCRSLWILRQTQRTLLLPARLATRASVCGTGWLQLPRRCARRLRSPERGAASSSKAGKKQTPSLSLGYTPPPHAPPFLKVTRYKCHPRKVLGKRGQGFACLVHPARSTVAGT